MDAFFDWLIKNKDTLTVVLGSGLLLAIISGLWRLITWLATRIRAYKLGVQTFPFEVIPPNSNVAKSILKGDDNDPLADRNIPYQARLQGKNIRRELEHILLEKRWLLILARTGLGKTREAIHLIQSLNNDGWTILYLTRSEWLDRPSHFASDKIGTDRKILFLLDDLNRKCYSSREERRPDAHDPTKPLRTPLQERLLRFLEAYEVFCGKGEILVVGTARDEVISMYDNEPGEWEKLGFNVYELWKRFQPYQLMEPQDEAIIGILRETIPLTNIEADETEYPKIAQKNDRTFTNVIANLVNLRNENLPLNLSNFRDTLLGTWQDRYQRALARHGIIVTQVYSSARLLRSIGITLFPFTVIPVAVFLNNPGKLWKALFELRVKKVLKSLERAESLLNPADGQIEVVNIDLEEIDLQGFSELILSITSQHKREMFLSLYNLILFLYRKGFVDLAERVINEGIKLYSSEMQAILWYLLGTHYYNIRDTMTDRQKAITAFTTAYKNYPSSSDGLGSAILHGLGHAYELQGDMNQATDSLRKSLDNNPKNIEDWRCIGRLYYEMKRYQDTMNAYEKMIELRPNDARTYHLMGHLWEKMKAEEKAIDAFKQAILFEPYHLEHYDCLFSVYLDFGKKEDAIETYKSISNIFSEASNPWFYSGRIMQFEGNYNEAAAAYQKALERQPSSAKIYHELGHVWNGANDFDKSISAFHKAIEFQPGSTRHYACLCDVLGYLKKYDEAMLKAKIIVELEPYDSKHWYLLGRIYRHLENFESATQAYQKAIELDPTDAAPWYSLALTHNIMRDFDKALPKLQKAVELAPENGIYRTSLVGTFRRLGQVKEALEQEKVARVLIEKESAYDRACLESISGNTDEALHFLEIALEKKEVDLDWIRKDPDFDFISGDPRFRELIRLE